MAREDTSARQVAFLGVPEYDMSDKAIQDICNEANISLQDKKTLVAALATEGLEIGMLLNDKKIPWVIAKLVDKGEGAMPTRYERKEVAVIYD
jgi:hypothetical protein